MSNWDIRFPKEMQHKATEKGRQLFAIGFLGVGRGEACMFWTPENITFAWIFAHNINGGMTPKEAFDATEATIANAEAERAAKADGKAVGA